MKIKNIAVIGAITLSLLSPTYVRADLYNIGFDGDGSTASGQIDITGGIADSGFLNITAGPAQGNYSLYTWDGGGVFSVRVVGGTDLIVDNLVSLTPVYLDVDGLAFVSSATVGGQPAEGINLSQLSGNTYNLAGFGVDGYGNPNANGDVTLSVATAVPEPSTIVSGALVLIPFGGGIVRRLRNRPARMQSTVS